MKSWELGLNEYQIHFQQEIWPKHRLQLLLYSRNLNHLILSIWRVFDSDFVKMSDNTFIME